MTLLDFLLLLLIAAICGAVGQAITGFTRGGCLVAIGVGFVGALIGTWIGRSLGLPALFVVTLGGTDFPVVWSILGSAVFVAVVSLLSGDRR
jgi:uncharacterized membrane protein YeaQ/YmgE (transglycosylase-associated protein family)